MSAETLHPSPHPTAQVFALEDEIGSLELERSRAWTAGDMQRYYRIGHDITNLRLAVSEARAGLFHPSHRSHESHS